MFKHKHISILVIFIYLLLNNLQLYSKNIDSITKQISNTKDNKILLSLYKELSLEYININDTNAIKTAQKQLELSKKLNNDFEIANSYNTLGLAYKIYGDNYTALNYFFKENELRDKMNDLYGKAELLSIIGETYRGIFEHQKGIEYANSALQLSEKINYKKGIALALNRLAAIYFEFNDDKDFIISKKYAEESNIYATEINDNNLLSSNYLIIGGCNSFFFNYDESLKYLFKAIKYNNISSEKIHKSLILKSIAVVYYFKKDYNTAIAFGRQSMSEADKFNIKVYKWLAADLLYRTYQVLNKYDSAFVYLDITSGIKNEMYLKEKENALFRVEAKYQKKDFELKEKASHEKEMMMLIIFIISVISILSILTLIIIRNNNLKKINKQLNDKNSIIEIQKEELSLLNSTKDKFFSIMAHDIKKPIRKL